jgi:hypothetical protein
MAVIEAIGGATLKQAAMGTEVYTEALEQLEMNEKTIWELKGNKLDTYLPCVNE